jgi:hypothetical protein
MCKMLIGWSDMPPAIAEFSSRFTARELNVMCGEDLPTSAIFTKVMH